MCTVSFLPLGQHKYMITSNRDDHPSRATSLIKEMDIKGKKVIFPKDPKANGTWIAMSDHDQMAVLLNGAFYKHNVNPPYKESRGKMFLNYFNYTSIHQFLEKYDFDGMEPFTFIVFERETLHEVIWDEKKIHHTPLDINEKKIWASCTLYTPEVKIKRKDRFDHSFSNQKKVSKQEIVSFHKGKEEDFENGFIINRNNIVQTLSITNLLRNKSGIELQHNDLIESVQKEISVDKVIF